INDELTGQINVDIITGIIFHPPGIEHGEITIQLFGISSLIPNAPTIYWNNFQYSIVERHTLTTSPTINNFYEQTDDYSATDSLGDFIFGQHPYKNSDGNLFHGKNIITKWRSDPSLGYTSLEEATLTEIVSLYRSVRK